MRPRGGCTATMRHTNRFSPLLAMLPALLLAGCGDDTTPVNSAGSRPPPAVLNRAPPPPARLQPVPGVEGVIGADAAELTRQFGEPRLDVWEGDARKLQFAGTACVLDVYLYPPASGGKPVATYVDARRGGDGRDVDRAACITLLRQR
jgi:hypothetical protein